MNYPSPTWFCLQSLQSSDTVVIGLCFLKTISEEWTQVGDDATSARKVELKVNLIKQVPNVFKALEGKLRGYLVLFYNLFCR